MADDHADRAPSLGSDVPPAGGSSLNRPPSGGSSADANRARLAQIAYRSRQKACTS